MTNQPTTENRPPRTRINQHADRFADRRTHRHRDRSARERAAITDSRDEN